MTTVPPGTPLPSRRELRERERAAAAASAPETASPPPTAPVVPESAFAPVAPPPAPAAAPSSFAPEAAPVYVPAAPAEPITASTDFGEATLTRRQLRALREAQGLVDAPEEAPDAEGDTRPTGPIAAPAEVEDAPAGVEDAPAADEVSTSRRDFGAPTTPSALILPPSVVPPRPDAPMSGDGGVLMTGSIQLPGAFVATGMTGQKFETGEFDNLLDPGDVQAPDTHSQPVSAAQAVSIHTETSNSISLVGRRAGRGITALIVTASVMAVLVAGILVLAITTGSI